MIEIKKPKKRNIKLKKSEAKKRPPKEKLSPKDSGYVYCRRCAVETQSAPFDGEIIKETNKYVVIQFEEDRWRDVIARSMVAQDVKHTVKSESSILIYCDPCNTESDIC
jgi:hypothetical protein